MLASLAGILIAPELQLSVLPLTLLVIDAYAAAMIGRLRNLPLTFAGALLIGLLQSYAVGYMPSSGIWDSVPLQGMRLAIPSILLFATLLVLPQDAVRGAVSGLRRVVHPTASFTRSLQGAGLLVAAVAVATAFLGAGELIIDLGHRPGPRARHAVARPVDGVGRADLALPDDARRPRCLRHGPGGGRGLAARPPGGGGPGRGGGGGGGPPGPATARPLPGPGHHGLRRRHGRHVLPDGHRLHLQRLGGHPQAEHLRAALRRPAVLRHLLGGGLRRGLGGAAGPAAGPLRPGALGHEGQ